MLDFKGQFNSAVQVITLEKNYRSTMPILHASNAVIDQAKNRFTKNLFSERLSEEKPFLTLSDDESSQAEDIANKILEYREAGIDLRDQAVLFRSSHHSAPLESAICVSNCAPRKLGSELVVFEHLSHAGLHEDPETFNRATLDFLLRQPS